MAQPSTFPVHHSDHHRQHSRRYPVDDLTDNGRRERISDSRPRKEPRADEHRRHEYEPKGRDERRDDEADSHHRRDRPGRERDRRRDDERDRARDGERDRGRDNERDRRRDDERDRRRDDERDRRRDDERERGQDRELRAGPSRRSASPARRGSRGLSRTSSKREASPEDKAKPIFTPSGLLAAATKTVNLADGTSTVLKYHEPPEARKPVVGWRLYVFKGKEQVDLLHIHRQSAYLIGRDRTVADLTIDHPSCSKQHAVIQYRQVQQKNEFGDAKNVVKPFVIDLESTNGTFVNDELVPTSRYFELKAGDVIKFGESQREYVLLHDEVA